MDKIASDAYSQGAYEALYQMNLPNHIKQAAAQHLTKTAGQVPPGMLSTMGSRIVDAFKAKNIRAAYNQMAKRNESLAAGADPIGRWKSLEGLKGAAGKDIGIAGGLLGAGGTAGAYGLGAFDDDEGLSNAQIAGLAALGVGGAGLAAHQAGLLG